MDRIFFIVSGSVYSTNPCDFSLSNSAGSSGSQVGLLFSSCVLVDLCDHLVLQVLLVLLDSLAPLIVIVFLLPLVRLDDSSCGSTRSFKFILIVFFFFLSCGPYVFFCFPISPDLPIRSSAASTCSSGSLGTSFSSSSIIYQSFVNLVNVFWFLLTLIVLALPVFLAMALCFLEEVFRSSGYYIGTVVSFIYSSSFGFRFLLVLLFLFVCPVLLSCSSQ